MGRSVGGDANWMSQLYAIGRARLDLLFFNRAEPKRHGLKWQIGDIPHTRKVIRQEDRRRWPSRSSAEIENADELSRRLVYLRACLSASKQ